MEFLRTENVPSGELGEFERRTMLHNNPESLYYIIGYSVLKLAIRARRIPEMAGTWIKVLYEKLRQVHLCAASRNMTNSINIFQQALDVFLKNPDIIQVYAWLKAYVTGNYPDVQKAIIDTGKVIAYIVVNEKGQDINEIISKEGAKVLEYTSEFLNIYIRLLWNNGAYVYQIPNKAKSFIIDVYFDVTTQSFSLLHNKLESEEEMNLQFVIDGSPFVYISEVAVHVTDVVDQKVKDQREPIREILKEELKTEEKQEVVISSAVSIAGNEVCHPYLANLISLMANSICKQNFFSAEIKDALSNANERIPNLYLIPGLREMLSIEVPFCQMHINSKHILLTKCRKQHCSICIFQEIRDKFTKENHHLTCNCGIQIAPKQIDEIKKLPEYKEFKRSLS